MPRKSTKRSTDSSSQQPSPRPLKIQHTNNATQSQTKEEVIDAKVEDHMASQVKASDAMRKKSMSEMFRLNEQLKILEKDLFDMETKYLESAPPFNAIRGYESLLVRGIQNQKMSAKEEERIVSGSSVTGRAHLQQ
eukprot:TRINITY_DN50864_c0_g1_i4.p3 TRINITY_DN50864_c0_g1~~TRINITY_DN50864_c0_g1_i4.p3  ORF type:complete len:136 (-),score=16.50 TRINITY_DN50864_c0_g1_i4:414-821(-)